MVPTIELYGQHPLQTVKFHRYSPSNENTLVVVHGGAWVDPNNTFDDFLEMVEHLLEQAAVHKFNIVGINYRLSPEVKHPSHIVDVVSALNFLKHEHNISTISLVGHSVGATLMLQLLSYRQLTGVAELAHVKSMVFLDGIYDVVDLLEEYPSYRGFVEKAFDLGYKEATQLSWGADNKIAVSAKIVIVQSTEDELLSMRQTNKFCEYLKQNNVDYNLHVGAWGKHEEMYRRKEVAQIVSECW